MMIDEQDDAVLKLVRERGEVKRHRAALERELRATGKSLYDIGGALKHACGGRIHNGIEYVLPMLHSVPTICDLSRVTTMLEELKEVETRLAQLNRIASEMGID